MTLHGLDGVAQHLKQDSSNSLHEQELHPCDSWTGGSQLPLLDLPLRVEGVPMSGLSDYLNELNRERRWSTRRIEQEAKKHGHKISYASASRYLNGTHPANPGADTLQAFADTFGVPINSLRRAAGKPGVGEPFDLGPEASRLTGPQREVLRTAARLFVEQNDALADQSQPDGATIRLSDRRPRLLGGEDPRILEMPFVADKEKPDDDPGEDDD